MKTTITGEKSGPVNFDWEYVKKNPGVYERSPDDQRIQDMDATFISLECGVLLTDNYARSKFWNAANVPHAWVDLKFIRSNRKVTFEN